MPGSTVKSFLVLFFKKELLPLPLAFLHDKSVGRVERQAKSGKGGQ
jgi:hypothetical protein